jgi:hypothetical protein
MNDDDVSELAVLLHGEHCDDMTDERCGRWISKDGCHQQYYHDRAQAIIEKLGAEMEIGSIFRAVKVIVDELW